MKARIPLLATGTVAVGVWAFLASPRAPATTPVPPVQAQAQVSQAPARWESGASGVGKSPTEFAAWRGRDVEIAGTYGDNIESQAKQWAVQKGFEYADWQKDLDIAVGGVFSGQGESWKAAAGGAYDARWRETLTSLSTAWAGRPGQLYIRFAHEFNGDWYGWKVTAEDAPDFVAAWKRFRALQVEIMPGAKLVFCPNVKTSASTGLDWRKAFPGKEFVDVLSVDYYNQDPFLNSSADFTSRSESVDEFGAPSGVETHRRFAEAAGLPFAVSEWSSNALQGDGPEFITAFHDWLEEHGGTGPGQVLYEVLFNVTDPTYKGAFHLHPDPKQPQAAQRYAELW